MKFKCYGTGAAEAIPALYCSCKVCEEARKLLGREVRSRHMSAIDDDIQLDIGPDLFYHIQVHGFEPRTIKHLIITHSHSDHFDPDHLSKRVSPFALVRDRDMQVIGSEKTIEAVKAGIERDCEQQGLMPVALASFETVPLDAQTQVTALPANHAPGIGAMNYLISRGGKSLLYAHDTGPFFKETEDFLAGRQIDAMSIDCTGAYNGAGDHHLQLSSCEETVKALRKSGALKADAVIILNHFSHGGGAMQWQLENEAKALGYIAAYDGIEVTI